MNQISELFTQIEFWLISLSKAMPLEVFAAVGSLVEEIVAPIPSPLVMMLSGTALKAQNQTFIYGLFIALISSVFKTIAQVGFYYVADKGEDIATNNFGKFLKFEKKDLEKISKYFKGGIKDDIAIILGRALPILPSPVISFAAGIVKIDLVTFIRASFIGNYIRSLFFMYFGYYSVASLETINKGYSTLEDFLRIGFVIFAVIVIGFVLVMRKKANKQQ